MSYCRWSSDDWKSDVYCWHDCDGYWVACVATHKHRNVPELPRWGEVSTEEWFVAYKWQMIYLEVAEITPIGLAHDGARFEAATPGECADILEMLRDAGYYVPSYAIESLREEGAEIVCKGGVANCPKDTDKDGDCADCSRH